MLVGLENVLKEWLDKGYIVYSFYGGLAKYGENTKPTFFIFTDGKIKGLYKADNFLDLKMRSIGCIIDPGYGGTGNKVWMLGSNIRIIVLSDINHWLPKALEMSKLTESMRGYVLKLIRNNYSTEHFTAALIGLITTQQKSLRNRKLENIQYF